MTDESRSPPEKAGIVIPLKGRSVSRCYLDFAFGIQFLSQGPETIVRIETPFRIAYPDAEYELSPARVADMCKALHILHKAVDEALALQDGTLKLRFVDGTRVIVPPDPDYEAWQISGPNGRLLASLPGGGLAEWSAG